MRARPSRARRAARGSSLLSGAAVLFAATFASAPPSAAETDPALDPTVLSTRAKVTHEFVDREGGATRNTTKLNLSYAFGIERPRDSTLQADLPVVAWDEPGRDVAGFGDVQLRTGHVFDAEGMFRWALGVETQLDTATDSELGDGRFRLSPAVIFAIEPVRTVKFTLRPQLNASVAEDAGVSRQEEVELKKSIQLSLPARFYAYAENAMKWDLRDDGDFSDKLKLETGRGFGARHQWVASLRFEVPLTDSSEQWGLTAGLAYVFP